VHYSVAGRAWLCLNCYSKLPESQAQLPRGWRPHVAPPAPRPRPSPYALLHDRVYARLLRLTRSTVFDLADRTGRMFAYCPVCVTATVTVQIVSTNDGPTLRVADCDNGCTARQIAQVLLTKGNR
jgi:hypothetical protein